MANKSKGVIMEYIQVTYRRIAKMLASKLPVEGEEFGLKVEEYLTAIKAMPQETKTALKVAYVFSRKVPDEEREDLFQDIVLAVSKAKTSDEKLAYAIARLDWLDWWRRYKIRRHTSLDSVVEGEDSESTLAELLVGETEFENKMDGKMDAELIWNNLPEDIKPLVLKRLQGKPLIGERHKGRPKTDSALSTAERVRLNRWVHKEGYKLLLA